jgi:HK97 family phage major capsid protein
MSKTTTPKAPAPAADPTKLVLDEIAGLKAGLDQAQKDMADLKEKASKPVYPGGFDPRHLFHATSGPVGKDSAPYSFIKAAGYCSRWFEPDQCKVEIGVHQKLKAWMKSKGWAPHHEAGSFLVPFSMRHLPYPETSEQEAIVKDVKGMVQASSAAFDPDEAAWVIKQMGGADQQYYRKALGTISDIAGGTLVGFPMLGELIDIQRNVEVMAQAGATEIALPPNGRLQFPKLTGTTTAYWIGEATSITESTPATGYLDLQAKKLGIFTKINNELLRFTSPTTEGMLRMDMARVGALKMDLAELEGTGGTQIKGLTTYASAASWTPGTDPLIAYTVTSNLFQPNDPADMEALLPDSAGEPNAWVMRRNMWAKVRNRRADAITAADGKGPFVFNLTREARTGIPLELEGVKVVRSSQVSNTRGSGAQTYVVLGNFADWIRGRFGVMEFLANGLGDTPYQNDQTWLRAIQHCDSGARHASSFVFADAISIS